MKIKFEVSDQMYYVIEKNNISGYNLIQYTKPSAETVALLAKRGKKAREYSEYVRYYPSFAQVAKIVVYDTQSGNTFQEVLDKMEEVAKRIEQSIVGVK